MKEKNNKDKVCAGCGYSLQTNNKIELGYIPQVNEDKINYCKRCYNMIFRNEKPTISLKNQDYWKLLEKILKEDKLYILVLDIFNLEGSIIEQMLDKLKNRRILLVLNKRDLLPKLISEEKLKNNVKKHSLLKNLKIEDVIITSSKKKINIDLLLDTIVKYANNEDVYLIGAANVGKSSLVNSLINSVLGENIEHISTSYYAGTTLGLIQIPLNSKSDLIDTPGIINTSDITTKFDKEIIDILIPKKEIKVRTYQLQEGQTLFLSGFCQLDYLKGETHGFSIYISNEINIHRTKYTNAEKIRKNNLGKKILSPPDKSELEHLNFKTLEIRITQNNTDLVIEGLGWINFKNVVNTMFFKLTIVEEANYYLRKNLI